MLTIAQLAQVKARDPYVYESLRQIVSAINALGRATGVDPSGSIASVRRAEARQLHRVGKKYPQVWPNPRARP